MADVPRQRYNGKLACPAPRTKIGILVPDGHRGDWKSVPRRCQMTRDGPSLHYSMASNGFATWLHHWTSILSANVWSVRSFERLAAFASKNYHIFVLTRFFLWIIWCHPMVGIAMICPQGNMCICITFGEDLGIEDQRSLTVVNKIWRVAP